MLGAAIVSGVASLGNSIINSIQSKKNTERTIAANKQLSEYQYSKDVEMWNKANAYNSPEEQMKRLSAAGLNPNLAYGSGAVAGNTSTSTPKYEKPTVEYKTQPVQLPSDAISQYMDLRYKNEAIKTEVIKQGLLKANTEKTHNQALVELTRDILYGKQAEGYGIKNRIAQNLENNQYSVAAENLKVIKQKLKNMQRDEQLKMLQKVNLGWDSVIKQQMHAKGKEDLYDKQRGIEGGSVLGLPMRVGYRAADKLGKYIDSLFGTPDESINY